MSFLRHREIYRSDVGREPAAATLGRRCRAHRSDESPAGYSFGGVPSGRARLRFAGQFHSATATPVRQRVSSERQPVTFLLVSGEGFSVRYVPARNLLEQNELVAAPRYLLPDALSGRSGVEVAANASNVSFINILR